MGTPEISNAGKRTTSPVLYCARWSHHAVINKLSALWKLLQSWLGLLLSSCTIGKLSQNFVPLIGWSLLLISVLNFFRLFISIFFLCQILFLAFKGHSYFTSLGFIPLTHLFIWQSIMSSRKLLFYGSLLHFINFHFSPVYPSSLFLYLFWFELIVLKCNQSEYYIIFRMSGISLSVVFSNSFSIEKHNLVIHTAKFHPISLIPGFTIHLAQCSPFSVLMMPSHFASSANMTNKLL